ncbi:MAG: MarR family transcriptional regulator [Lachnospiraceae bacterium]|nr:MarR family transcriptional regulator [Lachnospiraceae bacterium]
MAINIFENIYRLINKYNQKTKKPKTYGTEDLLYAAEVHLIEIIGSYEQITTTKLAQVLGITKGAVSQTTTKLLQKGLIEKVNSPERTNEVFISLSDSGKRVFAYHREMHAGMQKEIQKILQDLPPKSQQAMEQMFSIIDKSLDNL